MACCDDRRHKVLVIGASGAIGQQLCLALSQKYGRENVVAAVRKTPLPHDIASIVTSEKGVLLFLSKLQKIHHMQNASPLEA
eukprot:m.132288 g.132288  ORF g.132288 m.132288 type:complete len:82 (+) comp17492_c0_seq2:327-572(+)